MNPTKEQREAFEAIFKSNNFNVSVFKDFIKEQKEKIINSIICSKENDELLILKGRLEVIQELNECLFK